MNMKGSQGRRGLQLSNRREGAAAADESVSKKKKKRNDEEGSGRGGDERGGAERGNEQQSMNGAELTDHNSCPNTRTHTQSGEREGDKELSRAALPEGKERGRGSRGDKREG